MMTMYMVLCIFVLGLLGIALTPIEQIRKLALMTLSIALHLGAYLMLLACGGFALWPGAAPEHLQLSLAGWTTKLHEIAPRIWPGSEWLILAVLIVICLIPFLELVSFARQIVEYRSAFHRWVTRISQLGREIRETSSTPTDSEHPRASSIQQTAEALISLSPPQTAVPPVRNSLYEILKNRK